MNFSTLVQFSKLVADSPTSESVSSLLSKTVVDKCGGVHALVFGTESSGDFTVLSSYGSCKLELSSLDLRGVDSLVELRAAVMEVCSGRGYHFRPFPLISDAGFFGALGVLYLETSPLANENWTFIETLTELTAISLNKTYQHQRLQKAFDDLRGSQEALVRTEKLRALGEMSAGIAHDLKNLLHPLQLYTDHIRDVLDDRKEVIDALARMDRVLNRGLETVERLRDFSRLSPEDSEAVSTDLNLMAREALEISRSRLTSATLVLELGAPVPVLLRPADCVSAIVNLLFNAIDATEGKGTITVRTGMSGEDAWIEVEDNGPGIPEEIRSKIVEPLFTTKGQKGTGLGVSIVHAFTLRHGGHLDIESPPGHGARFRMSFPSDSSPERL